MHHVVLKNGESLDAYIIHAEGSQLQLLSYKEGKLHFTSISKSAVEQVEEVRPLTPKETELITNYIALNQRLGSNEQQIRHLEARNHVFYSEREKQVGLLLKECLLTEQKEEGVLTLSNLEDLLKEEGFKNFFLLQRHKLIVLGEQDELFFTNPHNPMEEFIPFLKKQREKMAELLNQKELNKETALSLFTELKKEAAQHHVSGFSSEENTKSKQEPKEQHKRSINFADISDKLNEHGFDNLRKLQANNFVRFREDGTIDFCEIEHVPFLKDIVTNPQQLADMLNQPIPPIDVILPFPLMKELNTLFQTLVRAGK